MKLPKVNERIQQSKRAINCLELAILETIQKVESDIGYNFEPFEIDSLLLRMVAHNHSLYIREHFKNL